MKFSTILAVALYAFALARSDGAHAQQPPQAASEREEQPLSGPQPGEALSPFTVTGVFDDSAGKELELVGQVNDKPLLLVFVHSITRPSIGLSRAICQYAAARGEDRLALALVFLTDDASAMESQLKRARHALPTKTPIGIYSQGVDGPGAYGLNRDVSLTVLVAKDNQVTANFALVQPSLNVDGPRIGQAIVDVLGGGQGPSAEELLGFQGGGRMPADGEVDLRPLLAPVIRIGASPEDVARAAAKVDEQAEKSEPFRRRLGDAASRIVASGKLSNYGTPAAQERIRQWAKKYGAKGSGADQQTPERAADAPASRP